MNTWGATSSQPRRGEAVEPLSPAIVIAADHGRAEREVPNRARLPGLRPCSAINATISAQKAKK